MMNIETIEKIKKILKTADSLSSFEDRYKQETSKSRCDKYGAEFNSDSRFRNFYASASFCSWTGYYGDSNCSKVALYIDDENAERLLTKYLNKHMWEILAEMGQYALAEAVELRSAAENEVAALNKLISDLGGTT